MSSAKEKQRWGIWGQRQIPLRSVHQLQEDAIPAVEEALSRGFSTAPAAGVPLGWRREGEDSDGKGRLLVCHDMMGGYLDDALVNGGKTGNVFTMPSWSGVSSFVYFSHERVSIPPPCWVTAAHSNGSLAMATVITEWEEGKRENVKLLKEYASPSLTAETSDSPLQELLLLEQLVEKRRERGDYYVVSDQEQSIVYAVEQMSPFGGIRFRSTLPLVIVCLFFHFDGYLINIESPMTKEMATATRDLLRELSFVLRLALYGQVLTRDEESALNTVNIADEEPSACRPTPPVLYWYDSVTKDGDVKWQEELNHRNLQFFTACDGIFTNYWWTEANVTQSFALASKQGRARDVFFGIDVFGRSNTQPGGFRSIGLAGALQGRGVSAAVFAPGWTFECEGGKGSRSTFRENSLKFWTPSNAATLLERPLPLLTSRYYHFSFGEGVGDSMWSRGLRISSSSWNDVSQQETAADVMGRMEPLHTFPPKIGGEASPWKSSLSFAEAFEGGSSLEIVCIDRNAAPGEFATFPLASFAKSEAEVTTNGRVCITLVFSDPHGGIDVSLLLIDDRNNLFLLGNENVTEILCHTVPCSIETTTTPTLVPPSAIRRIAGDKEWTEFSFSIQPEGPLTRALLLTSLSQSCECLPQANIGEVSFRPDFQDCRHKEMLLDRVEVSVALHSEDTIAVITWKALKSLRWVDVSYEEADGREQWLSRCRSSAYLVPLAASGRVVLLRARGHCGCSSLHNLDLSTANFVSSDRS